MAREPTTEADILAEIIEPDRPGLTPESARSILALRFNPEGVRRMNELAEKNRQGTLTEGDRALMEKYLRVGTFLNLMQAKARVSLAASGG